MDSVKKRIISALGGGGVKFFTKRILTSSQKKKPKVEEIWGWTKDRQLAHLRWYNLIYPDVYANIFIPVSSGCELRQWSKWGMGCRFCEVGRQPFTRYLKTEEILGFVRLAFGSNLAKQFWKTPQKSLVISFSSAGEPLLCYPTVKEAMHRLKETFEANGVRIYFSILTVGIADGIRKMLGDLEFCKKFKIQLRLSMHFPKNKLRRYFMPVRDDISEVLRLGIKYAKSTGIKLVVNWALIRRVNDQEEQARELEKMIRGEREHVLVRVSRINPCSLLPGDSTNKIFNPPSQRRRKEIHYILRQKGINCVPIWRGFAEMGTNACHFGDKS